MIQALRKDQEELQQLSQLSPNGSSASGRGALPNGDSSAQSGHYDDGRYEDADTPATGATVASAHSVPSDDTMIDPESTRGKASPIVQVPERELSPLSVLAQVAGQVAHVATVQDGGASSEAGGEGQEADADVEDVDAEGEPDEDGTI